MKRSEINAALRELEAMPTEAEIKEIHQMSEVTETVRNYTYLHIN